MSIHGVILCGLVLLCAYQIDAKSTRKTTHHHINPKVTAIHLGLLSPSRIKGHHGANATHNCKYYTAVESFAATFYTAFVVTTDPVVVKRLETPSDEAVKKLKPLIKKILADEHQCDADYIAEEVAESIGRAGTLQLTDHYLQAAYGVGEFLYLSGLLNCKNAFHMAMEFFGYVEKAFGENDNYDSYMQGMVNGLSDFLVAHQDVLKTVTLELADQFYKEFSDANGGTCDSGSVPASGSAPKSALVPKSGKEL